MENEMNKSRFDTHFCTNTLIVEEKHIKHIETDTQTKDRQVEIYSGRNTTRFIIELNKLIEKNHSDHKKPIIEQCFVNYPKKYREQTRSFQSKMMLLIDDV